MIPELGHFTLALALALALAQVVTGLVGAQRADARLMGATGPLAAGVLVAVATAFGCLVWAFVVNDNTVMNVVQNSHSAKPLLYKISGSWGNHEGSMVLWVLILALCGGAVAGFGANLPSALQARVLGVLALVAVGFLGFILATSNPFDRVWPPPLEGQGLNPILQDPGLAFHPPLLYLGYVGFAVTYAFAVAALIEGRVDAAWGRWVRPWALAAWSFLTLGIALGSWWAYYELGWGGYWFWDPVENASLMPWLAGCALLHSAIVVEKREALKTWTVFLSLLAFGMSLLGTFLVRSGVLNSVHAFANDPERGTVILILLALYIGGGFLLFAWRAQAMLPTGIFAPMSREGALVLNNLLLCSIAAVVLVGTLYPMFADLVLGEKFSVGPPFFNTAILPLAAPLIGAMGFGPMLAWKRARLFPALQRLWWAALLGLGAFALCLLLEGQRIGPALGFAAAAWIIAASLADIADRIALFSRPRAAWGRALGLPRAAWGSATAHAGMGVMILGLAGMGLAVDTLQLVRPGGSTRLAGLDYRLISVTDTTGPNFTARRATVEVRDGDRLVTVLEPERRSFPVARMTTTEAAIHTNWLKDLYIVLGEEREGGAVLRIHNNPLAPWIWLGAAIMALGGGISLSDRRMRVSAPAAKLAKGGARGMSQSVVNPWRRRSLLLAPVAVASVAGVGFYAMLRGMGTGSYDPRGVPSALLGKPAPVFDLPPLEGAGRPAVSGADLGGARPVLLNFFASWCVPCVIEHPQLMAMMRDGVAVLGIAYKDKPEDSLGFLRRHGNPFARLGMDQPGRVAIDYGLYGVPETYLIDKGGIIRWRWAGPITPEILAQQITPLLKRFA